MYKTLTSWLLYIKKNDDDNYFVKVNKFIYNV